MLRIITIACLLSCTMSFPSLETLIDPESLTNLFEGLDNLDGFGLAKDPAPCCMPDQWQGTMKSLTGIKRGNKQLDDDDDEDDEDKKGRGKDDVKASTMIIYMDQTGKRVAGKSICPITKAEYFSFIMTFDKSSNATGAVLNVFNTTAKKCKTMKLEKARFFKQCIPKTGKFIGSFHLGPTTGLPVNSFIYNVSTKEYCMYGNSLVTPETCFPVISHSIGSIRPRLAGIFDFGVEGLENNDDDDDETKPKPKPKSLKYVSSSFYYDLQASISDPSVFTPPSYCDKSALYFQKKFQNDDNLFADNVKWRSLF